MPRICENTHVSYAILRGKINKRLFEDEIQKKKFLDVVVNVREEKDVPVLAYCVLDNEAYLILGEGKREKIRRFLDKIKEQYHGQQTAEGDPWGKSTVKEITMEQAVNIYCIRLHTLALVRELVTRPEDYWWCSYRDYLGREWINLPQKEQILSYLAEDSGKAMRLFRRQHEASIIKYDVK